MKKLGIALVTFVFVGSLSLAGQDVANPAPKNSKIGHAKAIRIAGKVSDDGTRLVEDTNQRIWIISNVEVMKGYEGQQAVLRGRTEPETNRIQVLSIRGFSTYTANSTDSAFRR